MCAEAPEFEECGGYGEGDRAEDDPGDAEDGDAAEDGDEDNRSMTAQACADEDGIEEVVDGADDDASPDC